MELALAGAARRAGARLDAYPLHHACGDYRLLRIASQPLPADAPLLLVRAGVHGDETAGPIALARHLDGMLERAARLGVGMIVYPLGNPSGYQHGTRYNGDHDAGTEGNNDFLRYVLPGGAIRGGLAPGERCTRWLWASDPSLGIRLPAETALMHRLLRGEPLARIVAALDLHQDNLTPHVPPAAYHYLFGEPAIYAPVLERVRALVPLLAHTAIGAGFGTVIDAHGAVLGEPDPARASRSDACGCITRHDGTLTDLLHRMGVAHCVAPETTGATPLADAVAVNLAWVEGLQDLLAAWA